LGREVEDGLPNLPVTLLYLFRYLFWELKNPDAQPDVRCTSAGNCGLRRRDRGWPFAAMRYRELWAKWREGAPAWLSEQLDGLKECYPMAI